MIDNAMDKIKKNKRTYNDSQNRKQNWAKWIPLKSGLKYSYVCTLILIKIILLIERINCQ
jgi:hypothetical protein